MLPRGGGRTTYQVFLLLKRRNLFFFLIMLCLFNIIPKLLKWLILRNEKGEITVEKLSGRECGKPLVTVLEIVRKKGNIMAIRHSTILYLVDNWLLIDFS